MSACSYTMSICSFYSPRGGSQDDGEPTADARHGAVGGRRRGSARRGRRPRSRCRSLTKRYGDVVAVDGVSFLLEAGTITGYLGPNGAGKTTTLKLLLGLAAPTASEALVCGRRYRELVQPVRRVGTVVES